MFYDETGKDDVMLNDDIIIIYRKGEIPKRYMNIVSEYRDCRKCLVLASYDTLAEAEQNLNKDKENFVSKKREQHGYGIQVDLWLNGLHYFTIEDKLSK